MILLSDTIRQELNFKQSALSFLDFIGIFYKLKGEDENIFLIGQQDKNLEKVKLNVDKRETKREILSFASYWEHLSLKIVFNGLSVGEKYYPIYSPICYRGYNWLKDFAEERGFPFGNSDSKTLIEWYFGVAKSD